MDIADNLSKIAYLALNLLLLAGIKILSALRESWPGTGQSRTASQEGPLIPKRPKKNLALKLK